MKQEIRQQLEEKNQNLINMVLEKIKRDLVTDIAIVGLTGSFSREDFHEKSDLDLIIINDTDKGWEVSSCFILDDVGYDIYCTPWKSRLEEQSNLESFAAGSLVDLKILYYKNDEVLNKLKSLQQNALDKLSKPIGKECLNRANNTFKKAKGFYADLLIEDDLNSIRYASGNMLFEIINTLVNINNTYIKRGTIHYLEELKTYQHIPVNFESMYLTVIDSKSIDEIRENSHVIIADMAKFLKEMQKDYIKQPKVTFDSLNGVYEELWCNCRNKLIRSASMKNSNYAIHVARGAQNFLDELHHDIGTPKYNLMEVFDAHNMTPLKNKFLEIMEDFREAYDNTGRKILHYNNFNELYSDYMKTK